jgi:hypothetical protein
MAQEVKEGVGLKRLKIILIILLALKGLNGPFLAFDLY